MGHSFGRRMSKPSRCIPLPRPITCRERQSAGDRPKPIATPAIAPKAKRLSGATSGRVREFVDNDQIGAQGRLSGKLAGEFAEMTEEECRKFVEEGKKRAEERFERLRKDPQFRAAIHRARQRDCGVTDDCQRGFSG
jgi:hypothetical protein